MFAKIAWGSLWQTRESKVMAKQSVNKSALVRDYLAKYPHQGPAAIAQQINQEKGVKLSGSFVASVKTKLKQASRSAATASAAARSKPTPSTSIPTKKKPTPASVKATSTTPSSAPASAAALSQHIANLKAAAQRLGKDEAKRIIDLF
jgi:hypothetical protein